MVKTKFSILACGETVWDHFGPEHFPGGAPTNVLSQVTCLGHTGILIAAVGTDDAGAELIRALKKRGVDTRFVQKTLAGPTGAVTIYVDPEGKPRYQCNRNVAFDFLQPDLAWNSLARDADALFFTALGQRHQVARRACQHFLTAAGDVFKLFDCNIRGWNDEVAEMVRASLASASALKLNRSELQLLQKGLGHSEADPDAFIGFLQKTFDLAFVAVTLGANGALVKFRNADLIRQPAIPIPPVDTTGAGDAFAASLLVSFLQGQKPEVMLKQAILLAAFNCARTGAAPQWQPPEFASFAQTWSV